MGRLVRTLAVLVGLGLIAPASASAALSLRPVGDFAEPMFVTSEPNDANRLFVVERAGAIQVKQGDGVPTEFLDITDRVDTDGERGLLSMAFSPDYATNGLLYVFYAQVDDPGTPANELGDLRISEFDSNAGGPIEATEREVLTIEHSSQSNHNGGQLQFGRDELLYISTGDGGGGGDPDGNGQNTGSLLGKILRIDPAQSGSDAYSIPPGNPFAGATPGADEVWSYGLRNPWRFSFDRLNGSLLIGDVGQASWEEIDFDPVLAGAGRGDNFGWDVCEGLHGFEGGDAACGGPGFTRPVFEYPNPPEEGAAITGGYVVRDPSLGDLYGRYVYADLFVGQIRSQCPGLPVASADRSEGLHVDFPTSFGEDAAGRIYVASQFGPVSRLAGQAAPGDCSPASPDDPGSADSTPPGLELDARRRQGVDRRLAVTARVDEAAEVTLEGTVRAGRRIGLDDASAGVEPGSAEKLRLELRRREVRKVRRRLKRGRKASARVEGVAADPSGNVSEPGSLRIKLAR